MRVSKRVLGNGSLPLRSGTGVASRPAAPSAPQDGGRSRARESSGYVAA